MALMDKYPDKLSAKLAEHLLRRTMFGASREYIARLTGKTVDEAIQLLMTTPATPAPPVVPITGEQWVNDTTRNIDDGGRNNDIKSWWLGLMAAQPISLVEKMTLFWHNHFASANSAVNDARYMYKQNKLLRIYALGNFREFLYRITIDPAMLRYLNGSQNVVGSPQENYARELQELFTIGKGLEVGEGNYTTYTEQDVRAAARVLTGWITNATTVESSFVPNRHDTGDKQFSAAYQNTIIKGRTGATAGEEEVRDLIAMILRQEATAQYICRKIYRFFVSTTVTDTVENQVIKPLATIFRNSNFEIKPVLQALFSSVHFYDNSIIGCMIKTPVELAVGTVKQLQITPPKETQFYYGFYANLRDFSAQLQMNLLEPPNVAGWAPYYQQPLYDQAWINTATMPNRASFAARVLDGWNLRNDLTGATQRVAFDSVEFVKLFPNPEDPVKVIENITQHFFAIDLTEQQKDQLLSTVLIPGLPEYEWTVEWNAYATTPSDAQKKSQIKAKLDNLFRYMMRLAEYQIT
jgi:uncharacterized protein (DUF1800 family)